jgi:peptidyl-prolyl cis-trans isomerase SurA
MKRAVYTLIFLMVFGTINAQEKIKVDGIAAVVGNQIALNSEINQLKIQLKQQGVNTETLTNCDILETLMQDKILLLEAKKDTLITVSDKEVEGMVNQQIEYMKSQMGGSIDKVIEFYNKKTLSELKTELIQLDRNKKLSRLMKESVTKDVDISPEEVKTFFNKIPKDKVPEVSTKVEIHQLVVKPECDKDEEKKVIDKLNELKKKVEAGSSFRAQAVLYSEDPGSRTNGGRYELSRKSGFVQEFKDVAFSLDEGQVSAPFKTQFGWHILKVEEIKGKIRVVRHILMIPQIGFLNIRAAQKKLDTIRKRIIDKEISFEEAAREFSDDEETKKLGGRIVNPNTGESLLDLTLLDPKLHQKVQDLKNNEITDVFEETDRSGNKLFKIIWVNKRIEAHQLNFVKDYPQIKKMALAKKKEITLQEWINDKIKNNYIKIGKDFKTCKFKSNWIKK